MKVKIVHNTQKLFNINVTERTTIAELKLTISKRIDMPPEDQILTLRGIFLEDKYPLRDYRLPRPDMVVPIDLHLRGSHRKQVNIRVSFSPSLIIPVAIRLDATVADLRKALAAKGDKYIPKDPNARMVFDHWLLEEDRRLEEYGIKKNGLIVVVRHLSANEKSPRGGNAGKELKPYNYMGEVRGQITDADAEARTSSSQSQPSNIKIHIVVNNIDPLTLNLDSGITLRDVSEQIEREAGIPVGHQYFSLQPDSARVADLSKRLSELGLTDGDSIYLTDARQHHNHANNHPIGGGGGGGGRLPGREMQVYFKDSHNAFNIHLSTNATVEDAMAALRGELGGQSGPLWLRNLVDGNYMQDYTARLCDLGLRDGGTIEYVHVPVKKN